MTDLHIVDVRTQMPSAAASTARRGGPVLGVAIHHSASVSPATGLSRETARSVFEMHVFERGWDRGGYHYLVRPNGLIEYALDEALPAAHAGFVDPDDSFGLERGQYWNQHYLAVCLLGWFDSDRIAAGSKGEACAIPNHFTHPPAAQWRSALGLIQHLRARYAIRAENVRGHRELAGCRTVCPGANLNLDALRSAIGEATSQQHPAAAQ
jgi:N-acetyl-anhydromuramyl-L-alanine amidase AmpD